MKDRTKAFAIRVLKLIAALRKEADDLTAIMVASRQTLLRNSRKSRF